MYVYNLLLFNFGWAGSLLLHRLPPVGAERGLPFLVKGGLSLPWLLLLQSASSRARGLSVVAPRLCSSGSVVVAPQLGCSRSRGFSGSGIEPMSAALAGGFFALSHQGSLIDRTDTKDNQSP